MTTGLSDIVRHFQNTGSVGEKPHATNCAACRVGKWGIKLALGQTSATASMGVIMVSRRAFHQGLLGLIALSALPRPGHATTPANADEVFLNRLTFGAHPQSRADLARLGQTAWLDAQMAMPVGDAGLDQRLSSARLRMNYDAGDNGEGTSWPAVDEMRPLNFLNSDPADWVDLLDFGIEMDYSERTRPAWEVTVASLTRAVHAEAQLREVMTQFWHDHFSVNAQKDETTAVFFPSHDAMLREHALGNFRVMLGQVARSPAMLYYLNNADSAASPANENFARELLELHTLGIANYLNDTAPNWHNVPGADDGLAAGYIDQDVYEVARAFTGWSVGDGRMVSEGVDAPKTGRFHYIEAWHDPYQKRVLAVEFAPNRGPMADGEQVLDILAAHPGTAGFVCRKMIRRLLADDPDPAMVDRIAAAFLRATDAPDQIAQVIRAIVHDPLFTATPPAKLRRPFEYLAAIYRATGAEVWSPEGTFDWQLSRAGWHQHSYGPPTGHADRASRWSGGGTLARIVDLALYAHDDWFGCTTSHLADLSPEGASFNEMAEIYVSRLLGRVDADNMDDLAQSLGIGDRTEPLTLTQDERQGIATGMVAFAAIMPEFLLR